MFLEEVSDEQTKNFLTKAEFWEKDLNLWDVSSGVLIIREAGGKVTEPNGKDWSLESRDILASNLIIHNKLKENLTLQ